MMQFTGIVRRVDELGRIVLPKELRGALDIKERDLLEISVDGDSVVLKKYAPRCVFCGADQELTEYRGKRVCSACVAALYEAAED